MSLVDGSPAFSNNRTGNTTRRTGPSYQTNEGRATNQPYGNTSGGGGNSNSSFQNYLDIFGDWNAPQGALLGAQAGNINSQIGALSAGYGSQVDALNSQYQNSIAQNQLSQQGIGLDQASLGRQSDYYAKLFGIDTDKYNQAMGYQNQLRGFSTQGYGNAIDQLNAQASQARFENDKNQRGLGSQLTAAGSYTSAGGREARSDINSDTQYALTGIHNQKEAQGIGYRKEQAGIDNTIAGLTSDFKAAGLTNKEQQARLGDRQGQLAIQAKQLGLQPGQLSAQLQQGLASLQIDSALNVGQLMDGLLSNSASQQQLAVQILQQAFAAGQVRR